MSVIHAMTAIAPHSTAATAALEGRMLRFVRDATRLRSIYHAATATNPKAAAAIVLSMAKNPKTTPTMHPRNDHPIERSPQIAARAAREHVRSLTLGSGDGQIVSTRREAMFLAISPEG
jgi:hypothetical protein